jgi:hypothetical protein
VRIRRRPLLKDAAKLEARERRAKKRKQRRWK